jgi:hypothetical protein
MYIQTEQWHLSTATPLSVLAAGNVGTIAVDVICRNPEDEEIGAVWLDYPRLSIVRIDTDVVVPIAYSDVLGKVYTQRWRLSHETGTWTSV